MKNKIKAFFIMILIVSMIVCLYIYAEKYLNFYLNLKLFLVCILSLTIYKFINEEIYDSKYEERNNEISNDEEYLNINIIKMKYLKYIIMYNTAEYTGEVFLSESIGNNLYLKMFDIDESQIYNALLFRGIELDNLDEECKDKLLFMKNLNVSLIYASGNDKEYEFIFLNDKKNIIKCKYYGEYNIHDIEHMIERNDKIDNAKIE